jgi:hypothetical protein
MYFKDTFSCLDVQLAMILLFLIFFVQSRTRTGTRHLRVNENSPPQANLSSQWAIYTNRPRTLPVECHTILQNYIHVRIQVLRPARTNGASFWDFTSFCSVRRYQGFEDNWYLGTKQHSFTYHMKYLSLVLLC